MELLENLKIKIKELIGEDIRIQFYYPKSYVDIKEENLVYVKEEGKGLGIFINSKNGLQISKFKLVQMTGCCGICVSTGNHISKEYRGKGLNKIFNQFRIDVASHLGYTVLLCTDVHNNQPQKKTLIRNGWKDIYSFTNKRTDNLVDISVINL